MSEQLDLENTLDICEQISKIILGKGAAEAALAMCITTANVCIENNYSGKGKDFFSENDTMIVGRVLFDLADNLVSLTINRGLDFRSEINKIYESLGQEPVYQVSK